MKRGKSLMDLAQELERQREAKVDYVAPTAKTELQVDYAPAEGGELKPAGVSLVLAGHQPLAITPHAHRQVGAYTGVPTQYYEKMLAEAPQLLTENVNHWLHASSDKRMVRVLDHQMRAYLSDKFRSLDNYDLAEAALPVLGELGVEVISADITLTRFYIKAVDHRVQRDIPTGHRMGDGTHTIFDTCCPVLTISNSEVGAGQLAVETGVFTKGCTNLAIFAQHSMKRRHVGARHSLVATDEIAALLSDETKRVTDAAIWMQVKDVVKGAFNEAQFNARMDEVEGLAEQKIESDDVVKVVAAASKRLGVTEGEQKSVLKHLIQGGDLTRYGLFNAITRTAEDVESYDRATEFERMGGEVIALPANDWEAIAKAA